MIYLSYKLSTNTPAYGGGTGLRVKEVSKIDNGDTANSLQLSFPNHIGTHIDAPSHFFDDGKKLTDYDPSFWIFNHPQCVDVPGGDGHLITISDIDKKINEQTDLLLLRTDYQQYRSQTRYWQKNPGLSEALAKELRQNYPHIRAVGVDFISITSRLHREEGKKAHREFLGAHYNSDPILIIEDMQLSNYYNEISRIIVLPLMIDNADGAPCTIIAE